MKMQTKHTLNFLWPFYCTHTQNKNYYVWGRDIGCDCFLFLNFNFSFPNQNIKEKYYFTRNNTLCYHTNVCVDVINLTVHKSGS